MTCRDEVLAAMGRLKSRHARDVFDLQEIVQEVQATTDRYKDSTIRTHVSSRLCVSAPVNHASPYADLIRVSRGLYRLR